MTLGCLELLGPTVIITRLLKEEDGLSSGKESLQYHTHGFYITICYQYYTLTFPGLHLGGKLFSELQGNESAPLTFTSHLRDSPPKKKMKPCFTCYPIMT